MVTPIYTTLSTVLSNATTLVGGIVMCFATSWRLSMLAFVTILPMMHITGEMMHVPCARDARRLERRDE